MELIFDLTKLIGRQWREQSLHKVYASTNNIKNSTIQYHKVKPDIINVLNFPKSYPLRNQNLEQVKRFDRLLEFIENSEDIMLRFVNPERIPFKFDQLEKFKSIEFNINDGINTSFGDIQQLMQIENMIIKFNKDISDIDLLKNIIRLKNND